MKNIKNIANLFLLLLIVVSCEDDEYVAPNSFIDVAFTTNFGTELMLSEVNNFASFSDLSNGYTKHEWHIPEGAFFLKGPVPNDLENYDNYIINPGETVSTDRTVHVLFKKGDTLTKIKLYNEFDSYAEFALPTGWDPVKEEIIIDTTRTRKEGDKWIYEYEVVVDVYDTIVADMQIRDLDKNIIDFKNLDVINLKFGDELIFEDLSRDIPNNTARPTNTVWQIHTIEENEADEKNIYNSNETTTIDTIAFNRSIGTFKGRLISKRLKTEEIGADDETYEMPFVFNITALDEPFVQIGNVLELDDDRIVIPFSSRFEQLSDNLRGNFTVKIDGSSIPIASVTITNVLDANKKITGALFLNLETPLEPLDVTKTVTVSYDGANSNLRSLDERPLEAFTDVPIKVNVPTPVNLNGNIIELRDETIQVPFDFRFDAETFAIGDSTEGFQVLVNGINFAISAVNLDTDNKKLNITLVDKIYRPDVITISHDGSGPIRSIGGGAIAILAATPVIMDNGDILNGAGSFDDPLIWMNSGNGTSSITFVTPTTPNTPDIGTVAFVEAPEGNKPDLRSTGTSATYLFEAGKTYVWTAKQYIFPEHTTTFAKPYIGSTLLPNKFYTGATVGVWEDVIIAEFVQGTTGNFPIRLQPIPLGISKFYYDDMIIAEKEERP
ncbi:hypothetical protein A8C32_05635 [Flavivirga aquatica]|uniref:DUF5689 domain-containing protein n=1 Tax=Flavivirga aquatica TaxID=1849968 RepID=A0A1E5SHT4_9FLAO|nr:hypothetical protein [Flavivirga aquatica]OEJ98679.1 hypothetical protein A8C32_05635 [Flavivirga aquatica]